MRLRFAPLILVPTMLAVARFASAEECINFKIPADTDTAAVVEASAAQDAVNSAAKALSALDRDGALIRLNMALSLPTQKCNPVLLTQIAAIHEAKDEWVAAWDLYSLVAGIKIIAPPKAPANNPWAKATSDAPLLAARVAKKVSFATLEITGPDAGSAFAKLDGIAWENLRRPYALDPGKHTIVIGVRDEGFGTVTHEIDAKVGSSAAPIKVDTSDLELLAPRPGALEQTYFYEARSSFDAGVVEVAAPGKHWDVAYKDFDASLSAYQHRYTEYNRAVCAQRLGQLIVARRGFIEVAKGEGAPDLAPWVIRRAKRNVKAIDERVARVVLHISERNAVVTVDDSPLERISATGGQPAFIPGASLPSIDRALSGEILILLDPNQTHRFVIAKPGFNTVVLDSASGQGPIYLTAKLLPESYAGTVVSWAVVGTGVGALVAGLAVGEWGDRQIMDVRSQNLCIERDGKNLCRDNESLAKFTAGNTKAIAGNILLSTGAFLTVGGLIAAWWTGSARGLGGSSNAAFPMPTIRLGGNAVYLTGRF